MEFEILGPILVRRDGVSVNVGGAKPRSLLALLLLAANQVVSRDRLVEGLWGDSPPASARHSLDHYVSILRRALGDDRVVRQSPGYRLRVEPGELDLDRFDALIAQAHDQRTDDDAGAASDSLRSALALFHGQALADLINEPFANAEAHRLEQRRLLALEERVDADLAAGRGPDLVPELERAVDDHPMRERLIGQLMLAYYRAGRQSAALERFNAARRRFSEELGLEPSLELRELELLILDHDASLMPPRRRLRPGDSRQRRPRRLLALGMAGAALVAVTTVVLITGGTNATVGAPPTQSRLVAVETGATKGPPATELPGSPDGITAADGSLWVAESADNVVLKVDPASGAVTDRIQVAGQPAGVVSGHGAIWVLGGLDGTVDRIDPTTDTVDETARLGQDYISALALTDSGLWVADTTSHSVVEVDPRSGLVTRTLSLGIRPTGLVAHAQSLWVADYDAGTVSEVNTVSGQVVATVNVGNGPSALAVGENGIWVANNLDSTVTRIDPLTDAVGATIPVGSGPTAIAISAGSIWVANQHVGSLSQIDPTRNIVTTTDDLGGQPTALVSGAGILWVAAGPSRDGHRGGTLVLASADVASTVDPAFYSGLGRPQFTGLVYDTLVTFADEAGPAGQHLVPDLAIQVPTPTAGGTTYTFRLRGGIRYSDGRLLRASDFLRSFQRLFSVQSPGVGDFSALRGAPACRRRPHTCNLSRSVVTNDRAATVTFHLSRPDPDFLFELSDFAYAAPLPAGVPDHNSHKEPLPGTGPYEISTVNQRGIFYVRNPYFHEWSYAAQPNGNPDRIIWENTKSHAQSIWRVERGRADWTWDAISPSQLRAERVRSPAQLHSNPIYAVEFLPLNTHLAPFNNLLVRKALNFAIDRNKIADMYGGSYAAQPSCQPLTPGLMGYSRYCPYTKQPSADGTYHGPDLARARRLVARSGTRGDRITVIGATNELVVPREESAYVGRVLRSLGYRVRVDVLPRASITPAMQRRAQIQTTGDWLADYPTPSSYVPALFACHGGLTNGYVCNPRLDREMADAVSLQNSRPRRAGILWRRVDHQIARAAYWVPTVDESSVDLVSKRLRNYQFSPLWGFIPDQAWINE